MNIIIFSACRKMRCCLNKGAEWPYFLASEDGNDIPTKAIVRVLKCPLNHSTQGSRMPRLLDSTSKIIESIKHVKKPFESAEATSSSRVDNLKVLTGESLYVEIWNERSSR